MTTDIKMKEIFNREIYLLPINQLRDLVEYLKLLHVLDYKDYTLKQVIDEINSKWDKIEFKDKIELCYRIAFEEGEE